MSEEVHDAPFHYDPRGNRLERWEITSTSSGHVLRLRGPIQVVEQVQAVAPEYRNLTYLAGTTNEWTHELSSPEPTVKREVQQLLKLLSEVISLPTLPLIEFAIALDWYKIPLDDVDPREWKNTDVGELVSSGKYRYRTVEDRQRRVGRNLAGRICNTIERHAVLDNIGIILNIPGHDSTQLAFGSRLAATVAMFTRSQMLRVTARSEFRPAAKSFSGADRVRILDDEFVVPPEVQGQSVLIVDDVFRSGDSMAAVAKAAHEVGAQEIYGICATRTMRR